MSGWDNGNGGAAMEVSPAADESVDQYIREEI